MTNWEKLKRNHLPEIHTKKNSSGERAYKSHEEQTYQELFNLPLTKRTAN